MTAENYQNIIIGSGEGGKFLAWHLASAGEKTVVVERRWVGGSCPNINCLPSKNEIWSAKVADLVHHAGHFGSTPSSAPVDMAAVRRRKRVMVDGLIALHHEKYKASGAELLMGEARFVSPRTIEVRLNASGTRTLTAERMFLNLGTHATIPSVPGLAECAPLTHIEVLELDRLPEHLLVIGGGYVSLEIAQAYRRFGSRVTILQNVPQLLVDQDPDVVSELQNILAAEGIDILTSAEILQVRGRSGDTVTLQVRAPQGERTLTGSDVLVAAGRTPNTSGIGLELAGVELDSRGYIKVTDRLQTTAPNIWAIGECAGSPQFTHASFDDFRIIRENLAGGSRSTADRLMPSCLFTDPQIAKIGLNESQAGSLGIPVRVAKLPMPAVLRTRTLDETRGFMKAFIDPNDDRILGFTMIGPEAGEVMATVQAAMLAGTPFTMLRDAILAHPTMAEGLNALFSGVKPAAQKKTQPSAGAVPNVAHRHVLADGINVFYREAGPQNAPVVLLLHGFPASSFQFRELIPRLAGRYRVIAPDLPGFGFTEVPDARGYKYSFNSLAQTMLAFTDALRLQSYALYVFDYGAPTGFRLAMARPERVTAIVSQNGNAYEEGLGDAWAPIRQYWANPTTANREILRGVFTLDGIRREYHMGMSAKQEVAPESYTLDAALITHTGNVDIQLDLFLDYANNVKMYPEFHRYFRASRPPLLAIWGKNDPYFIPPGAEAFRRDIPNATVQLLDTGHFALETHINDIANAMSDFLAKHLGSARAATA